MQDLRQLFDPSLLGLSRAVGKEDVRDLDAKLVVTIEDFEHALSFRNQTVTVDQDTVDIEDKGHILRSTDLFVGEVLNLGRKNISRWLNRRHSWADLGSIWIVDGG
jgi:hypothetical protein